MTQTQNKAQETTSRALKLREAEAQTKQILAQDETLVEAKGYSDAKEQFKNDGDFSSGRTYADEKLSEAYDRGVNRAEAEYKASERTQQHTPGPWETDDIYVFGAGKRICYLRPQGEVESFSERQANARLIAAAPELLAALQRLERDLDCYDGMNTEKWDSVKQARAAIARVSNE